MRSRSRSRIQRSPQRIETLEARIVFDAAPAAEYAPLDTFASEEALRDFLLEQYRDDFDRVGPPESCPAYSDHAMVLSASASRANLIADYQYSDTNVQVAGVDEGDLVETDGEYIYSLSGDSLVIVASWPVKELQVSSRTQLSGHAFAMFLHGDRLTIIANADLDDGQHAFSVTTLDISDRTAPQVISTTAIEGEFEDARLTGGRLYVQSSLEVRMPTLQRGGVDTSISPSSQFAYLFSCSGSHDYETWGEYVERISPTLVDTVLPSYRTLDSAGNVVGEGLLTSLQVHAGFSTDFREFAVLSVIDVNASDVSLEHSSSAFTESTPRMYANEDAIVLYARDSALGTTTTRLFQIDISSGGEPQWTATGSVPGTALDQFSLDIHNGSLRIATTDRAPSALSLVLGGDTSLYVLQQQGDELHVVGSVEDFAPGETIYGVRYLGDHAFAITAVQQVDFEFFDPLFSFDLSDPEHPTVIDALDMPGYSEYLHAVGNDYLVGVGVESNRFGRVVPRLSLFRVDDLSALSIAEHEVFTMDALQALYEQHGATLPDTLVTASFVTDHHAFSYNEETGILALPLTIPGRAGGTDLLIFRIDTQQGTIDPLGVVQHEAAIERSVTIDGKIYSISDETLKVHDPAALDEAIASLNFREDPIDVNHDGVVAISDMLSVVAELRMMHREGERMNALRSALHRPDLDVDSDGTVTVADALFIATNLRTRFVTGQFGASTPMPPDSRNAAPIRSIGQPLPVFIDFPVLTQAIATDQAMLALLAENG